MLRTLTGPGRTITGFGPYPQALTGLKLVAWVANRTQSVYEGTKKRNILVGNLEFHIRFKPLITKWQK